MDKSFGIMTDLDVNELSAALFSLMNITLTGEAYRALNNVRVGGGLEVWRILTTDLTSKGPQRRQVLLKRIANPRRGKSLQEVVTIVRDWERDLLEYHDAGGTDYVSDELKMMSLRSMLPEIQDSGSNRMIPVYREFTEGHPGTEGEAYEKLKSRVAFRSTQEQTESHIKTTNNILNADDVTELQYGNCGE